MNTQSNDWLMSGDARLSAVRPTDEQQAIIDACQTGDHLIIEAGAGTGKTSTLKMLAAANPTRRGIYLAYNRAIADDAKASFPSSVACATAHSFAFRAIGRQYADRLNGPRVLARETARILGIVGPYRVSKERVLTADQLARIVMETVGRYCHSADSAIGQHHVPRKPGLDDDESMATLSQLVAPYARCAWEDITSQDGRLKFAHDHYLKMWQLSGPRLPADYVLLDETQDANPAIADIVTRQNAQQVLVGDRSQAIYGWRGAVNAMVDFPGRRFELSQSFRFGQAIADEANKWLTLLGAPLRLTGCGPAESEVRELDLPAAILCRTNAEAVARVMLASRVGRRPAMVGGGAEVRALAEAAVTLRAGLGTGHSELLAFRTWSELQEYVEHDEAGADLKVFVRLVDTHGPKAIIQTVDGLVDERLADVVISTAHKAKGREWDTVQVASDFYMPKELWAGELMLAYVAVTRARLTLDRGGLAWVDGWLPEEAIT